MNVKRERQLYNIGDKVMLTDIALDTYGEEYKETILTITNVSRDTSTEELLLLYDVYGVDFHCALYQYEIKPLVR